MKKNETIFKLGFIGGIIVILLIANVCIGGKLNERELSRDHAVDEINKAAGGQFEVGSIYIGIPYVYTYTKKDEHGYNSIVTENKVEYFEPVTSNYKTRTESQKRTIGIYSAPIFTGELSIDSYFDFELPKNTSNITYNFNKAFLKVNIKGKSIMNQPDFEINGKSYKSYYSYAAKSALCTDFKIESGKNKFSTKMRIRGADKFSVTLSSLQNYLYVESDWKSPGFANFDYLPDVRDINDEGFTAEWNIPFNYGSNEIGFYYVQPVDIFKMLHRAVKYGFLFIIVPFVVLFLFEIFAVINLHPLHYLLSGAASVIFFLLLLSFSEHITFVLAYIISAFASGVLVSLYVAAITKKFKLGFGMSLVFVMMYGYLFFSLKSEDYALLIGSLFAFAVLAAIMFFTRNVDWNNVKKSMPEKTVAKIN